MRNQPLSFWHIWNMSFGFMGIQFGWGLQMANMSAIYEMLGAKESELALLWIAAPLTGLLVQPIIGHMSDRTWNRLGRRKPYFLFGAVLSSFALVMMPNSSALWMAVGLLWVLDGAINIAMQPFRAFVADLLPEQQRPFGFSVQTVLIGIGAVVSSALPWILAHWFGVSSEAAGEGSIPQSVALAFYIGAAVLLACVLATILTTKENPPADMEAFLKSKQEKAGLLAGAKEILANIGGMPTRMKQLAWVQMFTWAGLFCMWTYFTPAVARGVFGATDAADPLYHQATEWVGVCFSLYNGIALLGAFVFMGLVQKVSPRTIHAVSLACGGLGLLSVMGLHDPNLLLVAMVGVGIAWASILAMPYAMLAGALPENKMGVYMGIFNLFIVIPQVAVALGSGAVVTYLLGGQSVYALALGGGCMVVAALLTLKVDYELAGSATRTPVAVGH
ncbi:MAG: MFS transporter [Alphaproteobacteria bacterium]|nr:MFS transporter [Alphaproteobacteria bacterium]